MFLLKAMFCNFHAFHIYVYAIAFIRAKTCLEASKEPCPKGHITISNIKSYYYVKNCR
jgi:hypothetical protein